MPSQLKIVMAQLNCLVGDVAGNTKRIIDLTKNARFHMGGDVVVFPELCITGYPPEDLLLRPGFLRKVEVALEEIKANVNDIDVIVGYPHKTENGLFNAAAVMRNHEIVATYYKHQLPNYSVFDEKRYFSAGHDACVVDIKGVPVGITICEDIWVANPVKLAVQQGAKMIFNINASPYHMKKNTERLAVLKQRTSEVGIPICYVNLVGGQDELVFDGESLIVNKDGNICYRAPAFEEGMYLAEVDVRDNLVVPVARKIKKARSDVELVYQALVMGVRDYINKNHFPGIIVGVSGGIDSALTLAIAADAIGAERVEAIMMPSRYTSKMSIDDARTEAENLGVKYLELSIEPAFEAMLFTLKNEFEGTEVDATEENIQARCRGTLLMALSNKRNKIVLTTGNKSENAVGYATLYGDMAGGFNALKDVPKTLVYKLAEYRNTVSPVIPQRVIHRAPSAELAPNQKDTDSLPDYGELDGILELYVENDSSVEEIVASGFDKFTVERVIKMVDRNEYKRRQAAPGVRISKRAFSRDRRYPITSGHKSV